MIAFSRRCLRESILGLPLGVITERVKEEEEEVEQARRWEEASYCVFGDFQVEIPRCIYCCISCC